MKIRVTKRSSCTCMHFNKQFRKTQKNFVKGFVKKNFLNLHYCCIVYVMCPSVDRGYITMTSFLPLQALLMLN